MKDKNVYNPRNILIRWEKCQLFHKIGEMTGEGNKCHSKPT